MTTKARRSLAPRRRRKEILEAAADVFYKKGFESASIQDISDSVGILKGSLYYYITSKEDLLFEIVQEAHEESFKKLEQVKAVEGNALQKIRAFVVVHVTHLATGAVKTTIFFQDFRSLTGQRRQTIVDARDQYENYLRDLIRQGQDELLITTDIDPKLAATTVLGMTNPVHRWFEPKGGRTVEEIANAIADFAVAALASGAGGPPQRHSLIRAHDPAYVAEAISPTRSAIQVG